MASQDAGTLALHGVPDVAVEVVVACQEETATLRERHGRDAADNVVMRVHRQFLISANIEHPARGIVRASRKRKSRWEESDRVDIRLVSWEGLFALAVPNVPQFGGSVARAGHERALIWREGQRHHVPGVSRELAALLSRLYVPEGAGHVPRAGEDLIVVEETAAREVSGVSRQFAGHAHVALAGLKAVNGADVVETTAGDVRAGGGVRAGHDPGRAQRDRMDLVRSVTVPHYQLAVLTRRH